MVCSICKQNGHNKKTCNQKDSIDLVQSDKKEESLEEGKITTIDIHKTHEKKKLPTKKAKGIKEKKNTLEEEMNELCIEIYDSDNESANSNDLSKIGEELLNSEMYIYQDEKSNKFWRIEYIPNKDGEYRIEYGKINNSSRIELKSDTWMKIKKLINSKIKKGYILDSKKRIECFSLNL